MSMTTELIERLKKYAQILEDIKITNADLMCVKSMREAANTIEELSAKLHASQMERSSQYYHGGWIPCADGGNLPEEKVDVLITILRKDDIRTVEKSRRINYNYWTEFGRNVCVVAWQPLPSPYREEE